jgi:4'-phosphopantetheinyl transferase
MIEWLVQSASAHPDLARGVAPRGLLGPSELERLASLKTDKRRRDWLLGRWTAKHLVRSYVERRGGIRLPLEQIAVESDADGAPRISIQRGPQLADRGFDPRSLRLSISHCDGLALCAIAGAPAGPIGADIEKIERRAPGFAADYFTPEELSQLRAAPPEDHDTLTTLIWSAKEAALKALRLGLTVDTRAVSCAVGAPDRHRPGWASLSVGCDAALLGMRVPRLGGWWRVDGAYVLTIAMMHGIN